VRVVCVFALASTTLVTAVVARSRPSAEGAPIIRQFLSRDKAPLVSYHALRHLEAATRHGTMRAWIDACTALTPAGFVYRIVDQGGSGTIRSRVLLGALQEEQHMRAAGVNRRAALHPENYEFLEPVTGGDGLTRVDLRPLRKDIVLVEGSMYLNAEDGDLVRVEGLLARRPSFWTRRVRVVRTYERIGNVRVPVMMESTADVLVVGSSSFSMSYAYQSVNGTTVAQTEESAETCDTTEQEE
jgi:hypothetical protein